MAGTARDARRAQTATRIRDAASRLFAQHGYEGTTIRAIAAAAGVDPSLVMQHYGSKAALFATAVQLPAPGAATDAAAESPAGATDHLLDVLGIRLGELPSETRALLRSMLTVPEAAEAMRAHLDERVANLERALPGDDARLRALLAVSGILGLTITRHFLELSAFDGASRDDLLRVAGDWLGPLAAD